ncbi:uncharacterized protein SCHCODRAFT_02270959 [Schizophyllum commune H4-8]|uniref:uncharacterized protein n=1 Tax=Schizophyllum commune (strain H4-8 / FGSC 9210) TaxID=578458 RepID=UPI00215FF686|nr:uncharacterized protein SCHCODRAFT_02270959 [Schizophyllum commune H4-8]KAI5894178.1 hypothetical protein SCHCODRAFT_02270959 [Schizophyllum commune H4-8]
MRRHRTCVVWRGRQHDQTSRIWNRVCPLPLSSQHRLSGLSKGVVAFFPASFLLYITFSSPTRPEIAVPSL